MIGRSTGMSAPPPSHLRCSGHWSLLSLYNPPLLLAYSIHWQGREGSEKSGTLTLRSWEQEFVVMVFVVVKTG